MKTWLRRARRAIVSAGLLGLLGPLGASTGCIPDVDDLETAVSRVCVTGVGMPFAGSTSGSAESRLDIASLDLELDKLEPGATVTLESVDLSPGLNVDDLAFADRIAMDLTSRDRGTTALIAVDPVGTANPVHADGDPDLDLLPILRDPSSRLVMTVNGDVPATPWAAAVDVCLAVQE